jgi:hypothetical protein
MAFSRTIARLVTSHSGVIGLADDRRAPVGSGESTRRTTRYARRRDSRNFSDPQLDGRLKIVSTRPLDDATYREYEPDRFLEFRSAITRLSLVNETVAWLTAILAGRSPPARTAMLRTTRLSSTLEPAEGPMNALLS